MVCRDCGTRVAAELEDPAEPVQPGDGGLPDVGGRPAENPRPGYGYRGPIRDRNLPNEPENLGPIFVNHPRVFDQANVSANWFVSANGHQPVVASEDLTYYLKAETYLEPRTPKLALVLKHKALRWLDSMDMSEYTMEDRYNIMADSVRAAILTDAKEELLRVSLQDAWVRSNMELMNEFLTGPLIRELPLIGVLLSPSAWLPYAARYVLG